MCHTTMLLHVVLQHMDVHVKKSHECVVTCFMTKFCRAVELQCIFMLIEGETCFLAVCTQNLTKFTVLETPKSVDYGKTI